MIKAKQISIAEQQAQLECDNEFQQLLHEINSMKNTLGEVANGAKSLCGPEPKKVIIQVENARLKCSSAWARSKSTRVLHKTSACPSSSTSVAIPTSSPLRSKGFTIGKKTGKSAFDASENANLGPTSYDVAQGYISTRKRSKSFSFGHRTNSPTKNSNQNSKDDAKAMETNDDNACFANAAKIGTVDDTNEVGTDDDITATADEKKKRKVGSADLQKPSAQKVYSFGKASRASAPSQTMQSGPQVALHVEVADKWVRPRPMAAKMHISTMSPSVRQKEGSSSNKVSIINPSGLRQTGKDAGKINPQNNVISVGKYACLLGPWLRCFFN